MFYNWICVILKTLTILETYLFLQLQSLLIFVDVEKTGQYKNCHYDCDFTCKLIY